MEDLHPGLTLLDPRTRNRDRPSLAEDKAGSDKIFVIRDRLSGGSIMIPCKKTTTTIQQAKTFIKHFVLRHGWPESCVLDRGLTFTCKIWEQGCKIAGTKIKLSTPYYPQTDERTEIQN